MNERLILNEQMCNIQDLDPYFFVVQNPLKQEVWPGG